MEEKIKYLNNILNNNFTYEGPKYLYKYRPFDEYTFDMLEKRYLFLCKASNLDDKSECDVSLDYQRFIDLETNNAKTECVNQIINMIHPYMSNENFKIIKNKLEMISKPNGTLRPNFLLDLSFEIQNLCPEIDIAPFINWIINIPEKLDDPSIKPQIEKLILVGAEAKKKMGICSLCDSPNIDELWNRYASFNSGYCIEYDISDYEFNNNVFPVVYSDERENNLIMVLVENLINQMIIGMSKNELETDRTQYLRLFLTKNNEWSYQKEWRLLGDANQKLNAPKIKRIILGKEVSQENKNKMIDFCEKNDILLEFKK